jgi:hypothetical protein
MPLELEVTRFDWEVGRPADGECCAIAVALKRQLSTVHVYVGTLWIDAGNKRYAMEGEAERLARHFDDKRGNEPPTFPVRLTLREYEPTS